MPFPLAHPAAVLPLRRYCPRFLSFPALVVGSLSPDIGYFFKGADSFSHSFLGSLGFSLPVGMLGLLLFYGLRAMAARHLPVFHRRVIIPFSDEGPSSALVVIVSLLLGSWTHLLLDSITHSEGWLALYLPVLRTTIATFDHRRIRVCHLLWYGCSFLGMAWLFLAFRGWQEAHVSGAINRPWRTRLLEAGLVASLLLPIEVAHHLVHGKRGLALVAAFSLAWAVGVALKVSSVLKTEPEVGARLPRQL
jgi:hypothetical protein